MKNPLEWSVKWRLYGLLFTLGGLVLMTGALGLYGAHLANENLLALYEDELEPQKHINTIATRTRDVALAVDKAIIAGDRRAKVNARATIRMHRDEVVKAWEAYKLIDHSEEEERLAEAMWEARKEFVAIDDQIFEAFAAGDMELAQRIRVQQLDPATEAFTHAAEALVAAKNSEAETLTAAAKQRYSRTRMLIIAMIVAGMSIGGLLGVLLARSIVSSLLTSVRVSRQIAEGRLGHDIDVQGAEELTALLTSLKTMDGKLNEVVGAVRETAHSVGSAADQLSRGNDDLSQRTQEQASALEETAASMEQMNSTVKQNADNARQAEQLARAARDQAENGSAEVQRTIEAMQEINDSSRKIADIIGVIDEIAFQTNLLALNAAVEAARAGEQDRGFAVVATEVRNLAQRSATAAKETKELINASLNKVRAGSALVDSSGRTLTEIMDSVKKVSDIIAEIAAASSEQAAGVDQVNNAVTQMDETTQQNAALVEQAAAASKTLQQQAQQLIQHMSFFQQSTAKPASAPVVRLPARTAPAVHVKPARAGVKPKLVQKPVRKASGDQAWSEF